MENIDPLLGIILVIFGILQLVLFFKMWGMTNDVRALKNHFVQEEKPTIPENVTADDGWAEDATDQEKRDASNLFYRLEAGQVVAKVISKKKMEIWTAKFWEAEKENPDYKLIFRK
jgi:hypothetical protein